MKKGILAVFLLVLGLSLSLGVASWAQPWGMKSHEGPRQCGHWGKFANLTPEQAGKLFDLRQKFLDDTASLRKDMMVKRAELRTRGGPKILMSNRFWPNSKRSML